jgi:aminoglycoside phosphotransferase (APT) family kinase protein/NDP-sugar pyrophosphorylase family protein
MGLAIVVLAAGLGTRYGGLKQLAPLGPSGEALLDYTLRDAAAAGFSEAVLVVGPEIVDAMTAHLDDFVPLLAVRLVEQPLGAPPRARPWGTAYATLVGADDLTTPFAVANADDAYGAEAIAALAAQLRSRESEPGAPFGAVVGYAAGATLSSRGGVSRAVCRIDERGRLLHIEEHTGVRREAGRLVSDTATLDDTTLVSMNLWGFAPGFLDLLRPVVARFIAEHRADDRELRLPDVVGELVARGALDVAVLPTTSTWLGVTHPEDAPLVRERLAALKVAAHFVTDGRPVDATPLLHGHIHDTYVVTCRSGADAAAVTSDGQDGEAHASATMRIVLQRLNGDVFTDLDGLGANLELITAHLRAAKRPIVAEPVKTQRGGWIHVDATGRSWRASRFAEGTRVLGRDATTAELRAAARAFAELTRDLDDLGRDPDVLVDTIPRFHDLARRRADLATAIARDRAGRAMNVADLIDQANDLAIRLERELDAAGASDLPTRIVHNDAKLDNVLVDSATGAVACIVDLDTVMAGTVLNDFGELARTASSSAPEDEPDPTLIELDHERFAALADGYVAGAQSFLLDSERDCLALAGPLLTLENGVRFLTDHLDGDVYFRIHRPDHNAQRARAQLALAAQMLEQLDALRDTVAAASLATRTPS